MKQSDRVRGVGLLCCHCVRNIAYYRAGWLDGHFVSNDDFWRNTNSNFLDVAVLEWCKVFADWNGKPHWRKVVPAPADFLSALLEGIAITEETFNAHREETRTYRDKFVAHLDAERMMQIPRLEVILNSVVFLYDLIRNEYQQFLVDAPLNLRDFYEQRLEHGRGMYPNAIQR